ncbi:uncharacterized protein METZ01_LOCUS248473 [marine metagenome]|uniref:Uncharacterized protein n=1 Tax=marine metagenome TaxID=408172 RepID=A0A382I8Q0_9ZZZZ
MKQLLIIFSILLPSSPLFGKGEETGVLFERRVNGKFGWYKGGDVPRFTLLQPVM